MPQQHSKIRLLMILTFLAFGFAYRITMISPSHQYSHVPDLTGNQMINYDITVEIIGAKSIIDGSFDMYAGRYARKVIPPDGGPIVYPPLMSYMQVPVVLACMWMGPKPFGTIMICGLPYIILSALCAWQGGAVLKKSLGVEDEMTVTATVFMLLFGSLMFWVVPCNGRFEFVAVLFLLLAMRALTSERYGLAGACLGLALMTKQTALPGVLVFLAVTLLGVFKKEIPYRKALRLLVVLPLPFAILIPFWIATPDDMWVWLLDVPSMILIMKVSFVNGVLQVGKLIIEEEALHRFLKLYSTTIILAFCVGFVVFVTIRKNVKLGTSQFCGLVAMASLVFPVLAKFTSISKDVVYASVFVVLWGASRKPGFPYDALWFVLLQSFILNNVPVIWKQYVGLIFYALVFMYVYHMAFSAGKESPLTEVRNQSRQEPGPT